MLSTLFTEPQYRSDVSSQRDAFRILCLQAEYKGSSINLLPQIVYIRPERLDHTGRVSRYIQLAEHNSLRITREAGKKTGTLRSTFLHVSAHVESCYRKLLFIFITTIIIVIFLTNTIFLTVILTDFGLGQIRNQF